MEVEIKVLLSGERLTEIQKTLRKLAITLNNSISQTDVYFKERGFRDKVQGPGSYLVRVRYTTNSTTLNMKQLTDREGVWEEVETSVADGRIVEKIILSFLGAEHAVTVEKNRCQGYYNNIEVIIDEVRNLGTYLELAIVTEDDISKAQEELFKLLESLEIDKSEIELRGYPIILLEREGVRFSIK